MTTAPLLTASNVCKTYRTGSVAVPALIDVSLDVMPGEMVAIMGTSGSGKTTLLNCLSGLDEIDSGTVTVQGHDLFAMTDARRTQHRAQTMGFVFQAFNLIPVFSAVENVELPLLLTGTPEGEARRAAEAMLGTVGLSHRTGHRPNELSGGEQQRVSIARAFVNRPLILLADEPTGNLDPTTSVGIMRLLDRINRTGTTVVMATHDRSIVDTMRRRVIELDRGVIVRDQARGVYE
jgi:putative ABC transport system ATP-binding protein